MDRPTLSLRGYALLTALLIGALCAQALAADFQTGVEAFERGDFAAALDEWRPLAEQGSARAQGNLGAMYYLGQGLPEDDVQAYAWLNIAVAQGEKNIEAAKKIIAESMTREELARAQELAREYWEDYVLPFRD